MDRMLIQRFINVKLRKISMLRWVLSTALVSLFSNYLASSIHQYIPGLIIPEALYYILPIELFDYQNTLVSVGNRLSQYVIMIVVSFILIITGLKKRRKGFNLG